MPVYELLCLCRPLLQRDELQRMIQKVGGMVYTKGGVVTNVVSYGKQPLAYKVRGVQGKFDEVSCFQIKLPLSSPWAVSGSPLLRIILMHCLQINSDCFQVSCNACAVTAAAATAVGLLLLDLCQLCCCLLATRLQTVRADICNHDCTFQVSCR
jgi:ribosomal protein S6